MGLKGKQSCLDTLGRTGKPSYSVCCCCMPIALAILLLDTVAIGLVLLQVVSLFHDLPWPLSSFILGATPPSPGVDAGDLKHLVGALELLNVSHLIIAWARAIKILFSVTVITASICSISAAIGVAKQRTLVRLARISYYVRLFFLVLNILVELSTLFTFAVMSFNSPIARKAFFGGLLADLIAVGFFYYIIQIYRSFLHILEAGGSGWECMSAEEIKLGEVEQVTTPLLDGQSPQAYV